MTHYGKIKNYDSAKGTGTIAPEKGGAPLPFKKADLQQEGQEPKADQRWGYETSQVDGGQVSAVSLQMEQGSGNGQRDEGSKQQS
jgi:CspA family cold shock protein